MSIIEQLTDNLSKLAGNSPLNNYSLSIDQLDSTSDISVLSLEGKEELNYPWRYLVNFTSQNKQISIDSVLSQSASITFHPRSLPIHVTQISSLDVLDKPRIIYGVITEFSLLSISEDEAHYQILLEPRVGLLANNHQSAIFLKYINRSELINTLAEISQPSKTQV